MGEPALRRQHSDGVLPPVADLAFLLRPMGEDKVEALLAEFHQKGLLDPVAAPGGAIRYAPCRWAERSPHPDSLDLYYQGMAWVNKGTTPGHMSRARNFFERALALDAGNIEALLGLAQVDIMASVFFLTDDRVERFAAAEAALTKIVSLDPDNASPCEPGLRFAYVSIRRVTRQILSQV